MGADDGPASPAAAERPSVLRSPANRAALDRGRDRISEHARVFAAYEAAAQRASSDLEAAALAQMAYGWANRKHPGFMVSPALERLLNELGRRHVPGTPGARPAGPIRRVLHVTTQVYDTGGHTRIVERWIERDAERRSTLLLLRQDEPLPGAIARALDAAQAPAVRPVTADLFERARHLRALAADHDLVVLHVSPFEVVPALAFADPAGRPPTVLVNHASHHLWAGVAATDVVASVWEPDVAATIARRGVDADRSLVLPLPVTARALPDRARVRAELDLGDRPVLLTVGAPYKLNPVLEPSFRDLAAELLEAIPDAVLLVAGPEPRHGAVPEDPRAHALGPVPDLAPLLAAADLLLDTWPASGATTLRDAASAGLPIVSLGDGDPALALVRPPAGLLGGAVVHARDAAELIERVRALLADPDERRAIGARGAAEVTDEAEWLAAMERVVAAAAAHAGAATVPAAFEPGPPTDGEAILELLYDGDHADFTHYHAYAHHVSELPPERRPADAAEVRARVDAMLAGPAPRAVAAPPLTPEAIAALLGEVRRRVAAGEIGSCVVVVAPEDVSRAVPLLEQALADGPDVDLELMGGRSAQEVAGPGDLVLEV
jgi:glycosyltransferase involved in cell wall biosynthesis